MDTNRQVYLLNPKELSPETIAVTFAKTSRSPQSFHEIAAELTEKTSSEFNEKWVVGYGHSSVAEHAVLHIAIENISRLAIETVESNRLASYTEKSTRYQRWQPDAFFIPVELHNHSLEVEYKAVCTNLFATYLKSLDVVREVVRKEEPQKNGESDATWERRIRTDYTDVCRYLLPVCALANVGMTINARELEYAIRKMLSSPLQEVRELGVEIKRVCIAEVPTLIKYAEEDHYITQTRQDLKLASNNLPSFQPTEDWCRLIAWDPDGEERILAAALFRFGHQDFAANLDYVKNLDRDECSTLAATILGQCGPHDIPLRELEHCSYTFELILDEGAYLEVKRHRMMSQTIQDLSTRLGYVVPRRIKAAGFEPEYCAVMDSASQLFDRLVEVDPYIASYVVPNAYKRRMLMTLNLREAYHFCSLRSAANAHFSVRRIALRMAEMIRACHPLLAGFMDLPEEETWQNITGDYFTIA
jgi:thymidylate synthase ThyX